jgi:hypothetical protein
MSEFAQNVNAPFIYISGCTHSAIDATSFLISAGKCRNYTDEMDIIVPSNLTVSTGKRGANGLDKGTIGNNAWYYSFVIADSSGFNDPVGLCSLSSTAPFLPAGYDTWRLVGVFKTNGSAQILACHHFGDGNYRRYYYVVEKAVAILLNAGASATYAAVNCASLIPPNSQIARLLYEHTPQAADDKFFLRPTGSGLTELIAIPGPTTAKKDGGQLEIETSNAQSIDYHVTGTSTLSLWALGFDIFV